MGTATTVRMLVLVESDSDASAVRALADLIGCDHDSLRIEIKSAHGVTNHVVFLNSAATVNPASIALQWVR